MLPISSSRRLVSQQSLHRIHGADGGRFRGIRDSESGIGPRVGFLLGSRKVQLHKKTLAEGDVFDIDTRCLFFGQEELPSQFECRVLENNTEVASAVLTVYRPRDLQEFVRTNFA